MIFGRDVVSKGLPEPIATNYGGELFIHNLNLDIGNLVSPHMSDSELLENLCSFKNIPGT